MSLMMTSFIFSALPKIAQLLFCVNTLHTNQAKTLREALMKSISAGLATARLCCHGLPRGSVSADTHTDGAHTQSQL